MTLIAPELDRDAIDVGPEDFLESVGTVFTVFDRTQDSGNRSYGVRIGARRYFVKTAGDRTDQRKLSFHERVELLRNAVEIAASCSHDALPRLRRVVESLDGPMLVYDWVDGELLGVAREQRNDLDSSFQRFRALPTERVASCLDTVYEVHARLARGGWIAVDFYDGCLIYDFERDRLGIVDLDNYTRRPFTNQMGRMFGSSRFMAPEEFELGTMIDGRTNVYTMGRTAAVFLGDGTLEPETFRGSDEMHGVVERACSPDPDDRYASVIEFADAWGAAR